MKHTGKILFGVLSTSALVGTGFAAWIVNNGFTDTKTVVVDSSVDTEVENKYSSVVDLTVVETDNSLKFASKENGEDLTLTYNLKANEAAYTTDFSLVTNEYIPDVTVSLEVTSKTGSKADIKTEVEKYLVLPEAQTITYDTWLVEDYKETGYPLNINFKWNTDTEGTNPQDWIETSKYNTPELQRDYFTNLANTLKDAAFTFTFKIGRTVEMTTFTVDENLVNGKLTFKDSSGNTLNPGTSYRAGTEVEVVPNADPYYKVNKVLVNGEELAANLEGKYVFTLDKASTVSATFVNKVNTVTLNYEETQGAVKLTNALGEDLVGTTLNANDTFKVVATPNENYLLKDVVVTQGEETLTDVEGVYTVLDNEEGVNVTVTFEVKTATVAYEEVTGISNVKLNNVAISEVTTLDYGTEVTITFDVNKGYELTKVLLDEETLVATEEAYKFTVSKETYTLSFEVSVVEVTYDNIQGILDGTITGAVNIKGKVVAVTSFGPIVMDENQGYILVYNPSDSSDAYEVGNLVTIAGNAGSYNERSQIVEGSIVKVVSTVADGYNDLEAVEVNVEELSDLSTYAASNMKITFDCRVEKSGKFVNMYLDNTDVAFSAYGFDTSKIENGYYTMEGYLVGLSGGRYVNVAISNFNAIEEVKINSFEINPLPDQMKVNDIVTLSVKVTSPTYYTDEINPTYTTDDTEGYISIEGNTLHLLKEGSNLNIKITAEYNGIYAETRITTIDSNSTSALTKILSVDFSVNNGVNNSYGKASYKIDGNADQTLKLNCGMYNKLADTTQVNLGFNKADYDANKIEALPGNMQDIVKDQDNDTYAYFAIYSEFSVEGVSKVDFTYKDSSDSKNYLNLHLVTSVDNGVTWVEQNETSMSTIQAGTDGNKVYSVELESLLTGDEGVRFGIVFEATSWKSRLPLLKLEVYK